MKFYVIEQDVIEFPPLERPKREYYTQSSSRKIDRTDIRNAKFFPNLRSLKQGLTWANGRVKVFEVEIEVKILKQVPASITKVF